MASRYTIQTGSVALSASATKSMILLTPGTNASKLIELGISFDQASSTTGLRVDLYRVTTLGSPAGTTATVVKEDPNSGAADMAGLTALSAEPTTKEIIKSWFVQPFGGLLVLQLPLGRETEIPTGGARLGIQVVTPSGVTPNSVAYLEFEE